MAFWSSAFGGAAALSPDEAIEALNEVLEKLENALLEYTELEKLPELPPSKYPEIDASITKRLLNSSESAVIRLEDLAKTLPKKQKKPKRSTFAAEKIDYDPGEQFKARITPLYKQVSKPAKIISPELFAQVKGFGSCLAVLAITITRASEIPKPHDKQGLKEVFLDLNDAVEEVKWVLDDIRPSNKLRAHFEAVAEAAASLSWVENPAPDQYLREFKKVVEIQLEKILGNWIELDCDPIHTTFSDALNELMRDLEKYVTEFHPAGLKWNYGKESKEVDFKYKAEELTPDQHILADFANLIDDPLYTYYYVTETYFGGPLFEQSKLILSAFEKQYQLLQNISDKTIPTSSGAKKMLFMSLMQEMLPCNEQMEVTLPSYKFFSNMQVGMELLSLIPWCIVTELTPVMYTIDIEVSINKLLKKLIEEFKDTQYYESQLLYIRCVRRAVWEIKHYVRCHHSLGLHFNHGASVKDVPRYIEMKSMDAQVKAMKEKHKDKIKPHKYHAPGKYNKKVKAARRAARAAEKAQATQQSKPPKTKA